MDGSPVATGPEKLVFQHPTDTLYDALAAMLTTNSLNVVVIENSTPIGTVSRSAIFEVPNLQAPAPV